MSYKRLSLSNGTNIRHLTYVPSSEPELITELQNWNINEVDNQGTTCNREINVSVQEAFSRSLKKYKNINVNDDILIPIAVPILKKLLSPFNVSNNNGKETILTDIKDNLDLSAEAYKKLKRILFSQEESSLEISDFPSPDIPKVSRNTAPPRLITTRKKNNNKENIDQNKKDPKVNQCASDNRKKLQTPNKFLHLEEKSTRKEKVIRKPLLTKNKSNKSNERDRGSSALFHTKKRETKIKEKPGIVCTHFLPSELKSIYEIIKKLGHFEIENNVSERTTHVIYDDNSRTVNLYKAIIRGCWILSKKWIYDSMDEKRWLYEERYERTDSSQFLKVARINRQKLGFMYSFEILKNHGPFYVCPSCKTPNAHDLENLILMCGGRITKNASEAKIVIGLLPKHQMNVEERWILQSIWQYELLDVHNFLMMK